MFRCELNIDDSAQDGIVSNKSVSRRFSKMHSFISVSQLRAYIVSSLVDRTFSFHPICMVLSNIFTHFATPTEFQSNNKQNTIEQTNKQNTTNMLQKCTRLTLFKRFWWQIVFILLFFFAVLILFNFFLFVYFFSWKQCCRIQWCSATNRFILQMFSWRFDWVKRKNRMPNVAHNIWRKLH